MDDSKVTIILLNYKNWQDTVESVRSVQQCRYRNYEIVIIENGSQDQSESKLRECFTNIHIIQTGKNLGYTGGVNVGIKYGIQSNSSFILLLNNDTLVEPNFLNKMVEGLIANPNAAIACGKIYYHPDTSKLWYAGGKMIAWRGLATHYTNPDKLPKQNGVLWHNVSFVTGCVMLLRSSMLDTIGIQDERFFMYLDDIEYSARVLNKGFELLYVPDAVIYHRVRSRSRSLFALYYSIRNRLLLINTAFFGASKFSATIYFFIVIFVKLIIWRITNPSYYRAAKMGMEDYFAGRFYEGRGISDIASS